MAGVKVDYKSLEEQWLIQAFIRQQRIEFAKVNAIYTAMINKEEAYNVIVSLQRMMFPEIEDQLKARESEQAKILDEEKGFLWVIQTGKHGHKYGAKVKVSDAPGDFKKWAVEKGLY